LKSFEEEYIYTIGFNQFYDIKSFHIISSASKKEKEEKEEDEEEEEEEGRRRTKQIKKKERNKKEKLFWQAKWEVITKEMVSNCDNFN